MATKKAPAKKLTPQEREDERDLAIIRRESRKPTYSFRKFLKELGYHDLAAKLPAIKKAPSTPIK